MSKYYRFVCLLLALMCTVCAKAQCDNNVATCQVRFSMHDSYGDGWNGCKVNVYQGQELRGVVELLTDDEGEAIIDLCEGDFALEWVRGSYVSEVSFDVYSADDELLLSMTELESYYTNDVLAQLTAECGSCGRVRGLQLVASTVSSLQLSWQAGDASSWLLEYGPRGFALGSGTSMVLSTPSATLSGLAAAQYYDVYLRSICAVGDTSSAKKATYRTACANSCPINIVMRNTDDYGRGWSNARLIIASSLDTVSVQLDDYSNYDSIFVTLCSDEVSLYWQGGYDNYSCAFRVYDSEGELVCDFDQLGGLDSPLLYTFDHDCSSCGRPSAPVLAGGTPTSVAVRWNATGADSYIVGIAPVWQDSYTYYIVSDTIYAFTGLNADETYRVMLRAICGSDTSRAAYAVVHPAPEWIPVIYVSNDGTSSGTGASWSDAVMSLRSALELAQEYQFFYSRVPEIWMARGRYRDTEAADANNAIFTLLPGLHIYGGLEGNEPAGYDMAGRDLSLSRTEISTWEDGTLFYQPEPFTSAAAAVLDGLVLNANTRFADLKDYATLRNCELSNAWNTAPVLVVQAYNSDPATQVALDKCKIMNSSCAQNSVVLLAHARMENCLVVDCRAAQNIVKLVDGAIVSHSDIVDNISRMDNVVGGAVNEGYAASQIQNSVVWNSSDYGSGLADMIGSGVDVSHSAVWGGFAGVGNISLDGSNNGTAAGTNYPNFVYPPYDVRVNSGSALIDAASSTVATDLYGNPRPYGASPDMGCYEYQGADQCPNTDGLYVSYTYSYAAILSFEAFVGHNYTLRYRPQDGSQWTALDFTVDSSMVPFLYGETGSVSMRLDNLAGATDYFVQLIHHCPFGDSDPVQTEFTTDCPSSGGQDECDTEACPQPGVLVYPVITDTVMTFTVDVAHRPVLKYQYAGGPVVYVTDYTPSDRDYARWQMTAPAYANSNCNVWLANVCPNGDTSEWLSLSVYIPPVNTSRLYVRQGAQGVGNGTSWHHACTDIHHAVAHAQAIWNYYRVLCDIWVAEGTYYGDTSSNSSSVIDLDRGWNIYGGFAGNEPADFDINQRRIADHPTILDGQHQRGVITRSYSNSSEHATYSGLIIQNGNRSYNAGGVYANSPITLSHCIVRNNESGSSYGGGVNLSGGRMLNCLIADNYAPNYGGAYLVNTRVDHCTFAGNRAANYSALRFYGNSADSITNSVIWGNVNTSGSSQIYRSGGVCENNAVSEFLNGTANTLLAVINAGTTDSNYAAFADPQNGDYRLTSSSSCINKAAAYHAYPFDLAGNARIFANVADLGCYEYSGQTYCVPPYHVWVEEVSGTSALLRWSGYTDDVVIEITPAGQDSWSAHPAQGGQYALLGLETEHQYQVRIKSVCNTAHSLYSQPLTFSTVCPSSNQFVFGNPSGYLTTYSTELPLHPYYRYSHTQTIITADELSGQSITIPSIAYQYIHNNPVTRNISIYMAHTSAASFSSSFMRVPAADYTLVFSGSVTFSRQSLWTTIPLDTPFEYNGVDNLAIAVIDNTGSYTSSGNYFATHATNTNQSVSQYTDNYSYSISDISSTNLRSYRPNLQIVLPCDTSACQRPNLLPIQVTDQQVKLICDANSGYQIQYRQSGDADYITLAPSDTITLTGLLQNTSYVFRARTICSNADTSAWTTLTVATQLRRATRFYVKPEACGSGDGTSWDNAMSSINLAIVNAEAVWNTYHTRAQIWVAEGTYHGNTADQNAFTVRKGVDVYGGFVGNEPEDYDLSLRDCAAHPTILDGQQQQRVLGQDDHYYFDTVRWDGFVIQHGISAIGGGAYLLTGTTLSNSIITHCEADYAGGVYLHGGRLENSRIDDNLAHTSGGGAEINNATVVNCTFVNDTAYSNSALTLYGATVVNTLIANNSATSSTIGLSPGDTLINCVIVANHSVVSTPQNNPFSSYSDVPVINSVVWGNQSDAISTAAVPRYNVAFDHCAIQGPAPADAMNNTVILSASNDDGLFSPRFVRPSSAAGMGHADGDWTLQPNSVLINSGTNAVAPIRFSATDLVGNARLQGGTVDIGCYESTSSEAPLPTFADHIIYVTPEGAGLRDGTSWANAMGSIQEASQLASLHDSLSVWVAAGTYYGDTTSDRAFLIAPGTQLFGGFVGNEPANYDIALRNCQAHPTILDGDGRRAVLDILSSTSSANPSRVDGFVIQNGYSRHLSGVGVSMGCYSTLVNCVIRNNVADSVVSSGIRGVALAISDHRPYNTDTDLIVVDRCRIENNVGHGSTATGPAYGTIAFGYGVMSNTLVANNDCQYYGVLMSDYSARFQHCTFVANRTLAGASFGLSSYGTTFRNSIIWRNLAPIVDEYTPITDLVFQHCAMDDRVPGTDNLFIASTNEESNVLAPGFVAPTAGLGSGYQGGDWHLRQGSVCVGRGGGVPTAWLLDLDGNPRLQADGTDLGCYESAHQSTALPPIGDIIYVTPDGTGDGSSWGNALGNLNTALALACYAAELPSVWVAGGVYYGDTVRDEAFVMVEGVNVYGSMRGDEPPTFDPDSRYADGDAAVPTTVLDGGHRRRVLLQPQAFGTPTRWDGFEIRNGRVANPSNAYRAANGAGAYLQNNGQLRNSVVRDNTVDSVYYVSGVGVYAAYGATVQGCDIWGNGPQEGSTIGVDGGGLALANASAHDCHVHHNRATSGGGIYAQGSVVANMVADNNEAANGGGLYLSQCQAVNIEASGNTASRSGSGIYSAYDNALVGGLVANNRTGDAEGAGIYSSGRCDIYNYTVVDNVAEAYAYYGASSVGVSGYADLHNSVLWGNRCETRYAGEQSLLGLNGYGSGRTFDHCAIEGDSLVDGLVVLASDNAGTDSALNYPQFVSPENADYRIAPSSALYNGGGNTVPATFVADIAGRPRIYADTIDIGCYEYDGQEICYPMSRFGIVMRAGTDVLFGWSGRNQTPDGLEFWYRQQDDGQWTIVPLASDASTHFLRQLAPQTAYEAKVRTLCGFESGQVFTRTVAFRTDCPQGQDTVFDVVLAGDDDQSYFPFSGTFYSGRSGYSYTQQIYPAASLQGFVGVIDSLFFRVAEDNTQPFDFQIYLGLTDKESFLHNGDYIDPLQLALVHDGPLGANVGGYRGVGLAQPFVYDGNSNLVVAVRLNQCFARGGYFVHRYDYYDTAYHSLQYSSSTPINLRRISEDSRLLGHLSDIRLVSHHCQEDTCAAPLLAISEITRNSVAFEWDADSTVTFQYRRFDEPTFTTVQPSRLDGTTLAGLVMGTRYVARLRQQCPYGATDWYEIPFTTRAASLSRLYVTPQGAGLGDGSSWGNAVSGLRQAQRMADNIYQQFGITPEIWVAEGTYYGDTLALDAFVLAEGINLYGGFAGNEPEDFDLSQRDIEAHPTILDASNTNRVLVQKYDFGTPTVCDGFILQNGYGIDASGVGAVIRGNGVLRNCIVRNNTCVANDIDPHGAGVMAYSTHQPAQIINTVISGNYSARQSYRGVLGGGLYAQRALVANCRIVDNNAHTGGGLYAQEDVKVFNTVIAANQAYSVGGARLNRRDTLANVTVALNVADATSGGVYCETEGMSIHNAIIWGNKIGYTISNYGYYTPIHSSAVEGGIPGASDVINLSSMNDGTSSSEYYVRFADPQRRNFALHPASNCVDAGDTTLDHWPTDIMGAARIMGATIDMGAYESETQFDCLSPINLRSTGVTATSVSLAWSPRGTEAQWVLVISDQDNETTLTTYDTVHTVTGLTVGNQYTFYVKAYCGSTYSLSSPQLTISTLCDTASLQPLSPVVLITPADSSVVYANRVNLVWSSVPEATSYDLYLWSDDMPLPTAPSITGLQINALGDVALPHYDNGVYYHWKVVAWNQCISRSSSVGTFRASPLPDLHVTDITYSAPTANQAVTITYTVTNHGQGATPPGATWNDYFWIVTGVGIRMYDPSDASGFLGQVPNLRSLGPGESYTNSVTYTIPPQMIGNYFLFVLADQADAYDIRYAETENAGLDLPIPYTPSLTGSPYLYLMGNFHNGNNMREVDDRDNFFYRSISILPPPTPDLQVTHVSHPTATFSNQFVPFSWTVTNNGSSQTGAGRWVDYLYLQSDEGPLDLATAIALDSVWHFGTLAVGSSYTVDHSVRIPIQVFGSYYVHVVTDKRNQLYESIYETNNQATSPQPIDITMAPVADLVVSSISFPDTVSPLCSYPLSSTITNVGAGATNNSQWLDNAYLSPTPYLDARTAVPLGSYAYNHRIRFSCYEHNGNETFCYGDYDTGPLVPDSSYVQFDYGDRYRDRVYSMFFAGRSYDKDELYSNLYATMPRYVGGDYYIIVRTDADDDVFEYGGEDNNALAKPVYIATPDLVVTNIVHDTVVEVGRKLHVSAYIKNIGEGRSRSFVYNRLMLDDDTAYAGVWLDLAPGDSQAVAFDYTQPCTFGSQSHFRIQTNVSYKNSDTLFEYRAPFNNVSDSYAYHVRRPDLVAGAVECPDTVWSGQPAMVSFQLCNMGDLKIDSLNNRVNYEVFINNRPDQLVADDAHRVGSGVTRLNLLPGQTGMVSQQVGIPNGYDGVYFLHVVLDPANMICESNEDNNTCLGTSPMRVNLSPYPDLVVADATVPDTVSLGQSVVFSFSIANQGIAPVAGNLTTRVFMSQSSVLDQADAVPVATLHRTVDLAVGDTLAAVVSGLIPNNLVVGQYYFYFVVDYPDDYYEYTFENNNSYRSSRRFVKAYPLDLAIDSLVGPRVVEWGQVVHYTMYVANRSAVRSQRLFGNQLYASEDGNLRLQDTIGRNVGWSASLEPGATAALHFTFKVPYGAPEQLFLYGICDNTRANPDIDYTNNQVVVPLVVNPVATVDYQVSHLHVLDSAVSGQSVRIAYQVRNVSDGITTGSYAYRYDRLFLSGDTAFSAGDIYIGQKWNGSVLNLDSVEYDTVSVNIPLPYQGDMHMLVYVNGARSHFETNTDNNVASAPIHITLPPPGDLMVRNIATPDTVVSGLPARFAWTVVNVGVNSISGAGLSSLAYISDDDRFDAGDRLAGSVATNGYLNLAPGDTVRQELHAVLNGMPEGDYYLFVKTDVRNVFYEDNEDNNEAVSPAPFAVRLRQLPFGVTVFDTLVNGQMSDYKLPVDTVWLQTVRISVVSPDSLRGAVNNIYVANNTIADNLSYHLSTIAQNVGNPELYIPATKGDYYGVSIYGNTPTAAQQVVGIRADILPFELNGISPGYGGNDGKVTVELTGSHFRPDMKVWLERNGDTIFADNFTYVNYYQSYAQFNLLDADTGRYAVGVLNYCEGESALRDAFEVRPPVPIALGYNLVLPNSPRGSRIISMMLEFGNIGNTDIRNAVLEVESVGDCPISLTPEGLSQNTTLLRLPLSIEGEPEGLLRPGVRGSIPIYCRTSGNLVFSIKEVNGM